jgi:NACHT domain
MTNIGFGMSSTIKRTAITRAGYEYQDLAGIELLIKQYRDPNLYDWVMLEADDTAFRSLDDVVGARKDGTFDLVQVKFTVDSDRYALDWNWLLDKSENGSSMLGKWCSTFHRILSLGTLNSATLKTNRVPTAGFAACMDGTRVDLGRVPEAIVRSLFAECGGEERAERFFAAFDFSANSLSPERYEAQLRDQILPTDTDMLGWLVFRSNVREWAIYKNRPTPDGKITRDHVVRLITKKRPTPIRQDFLVPEGYSPPSSAFHENLLRRISDDANALTIVWGTPGRGKSTYLSYLTQELEDSGAAVARHHYFLSLDESSSARTSFYDIAASLLEQLYVRKPEAMYGVVDDPQGLRVALTTVSANLAANNQRLFIIVDGLDHVWRDTRRVDALNHLFNELLPLPPNVSLIVGTQRVADMQLPARLVSAALASSWLEIPAMDQVSVHQWVLKQDKDRPLNLRFAPAGNQREEALHEIASAFFDISGGHPLHLIYAYETAFRGQNEVDDTDIRLLPSCPDGDIRSYYQGLWTSLSDPTRQILHVLAGSGFFWPAVGLRRTFGSYAEIDFLLEHRNVGLVPFHSSIFAWVNERSDHEEVFGALLPKIAEWLEKDAPEYWNWGWLWLTQARLGTDDNLTKSTTRDWVVESLVSGWPERQIKNILGEAEEAAFHAFDLPRTVALRSLKTRVSNAREYQARDFASFRATALATSENRQQTHNLLDDLNDLSDSDVLELARKGPRDLRSVVQPACLNELGRRVDAWISLRHRPQNEFSELSDKLLKLSARMGVPEVRRSLRYIRGFRDPGPQLTRFIRLLDEAGNVAGLDLIGSRLGAARWADQRRLIIDAEIRAATFECADVGAKVAAFAEPLSPFACCWLLWREPMATRPIFVTAPNPELLRERYSLSSNPDLEEFFIDFFWSTMRSALLARGSAFSLLEPSWGCGEPGWLRLAVSVLQQLALDIADGRVQPDFAVAFEAADALEKVLWGPSPERDHRQYQAFASALRLLAFDLHCVGVSASPAALIPRSDFTRARRSRHWVDEFWIQFNIGKGRPLVEREAIEELLSDRVTHLESHVVEFSERSESWCQLAELAYLYDDERSQVLLRHSAECLVGYGYRKDPYAMDLVDAMSELAIHRPAKNEERFKTLAPIIDQITEFTDGDETGHVRTEFVGFIAKFAPEKIASLYSHFVDQDEHYYADHCLAEFASYGDLSQPEAAAIIGTILDFRTLRVLEKRAANDPHAKALFEEQTRFLGGVPTGSKERQNRSFDPPSSDQLAAESIDAGSIPPNEVHKLLAAAEAVHYERRSPFIAKWISHWEKAGQGAKVISSVKAYIDSDPRPFGADALLDHVFDLSLAVQGKSAAYHWLVRAHIARHGWQSYYASEKEVVARLKKAARHYKSDWKRFIIDTSEPAIFYKQRGYSFVIGHMYLVRFLIMVDEIDLADSIVDSFIATFVEEVREQPIPEATWLR